MGAFYNSICLPGDRREAVRSALDRWLTVKGFEACDAPVLFDLDGDHERSIHLLANDRWTVLFYSHYDEERRLLRELEAGLSPLLYLWVYDSEVWGYDLFDRDGFAGSFSSDPRSHQSFADVRLGGPDRPRGGAEELGGLFDRPEWVEQVRGVERRRAVFQEDLCRELCRILEVEVAASSYDDLELGALNGLPDWSAEQLHYVHRDFMSSEQGIDLHRQRLTRHRHGVGLVPDETVELAPEIVAEMQRMRRRVRRTARVLRPFSWLARSWRDLRRRRGASDRLPPSSRPGPPHRRPAASAGYHLESAVLRNERHRCRITLAEGIIPGARSAKPAAVFAFEVNGVTVTCTARRLQKIDEVLRKPDHSKVLCDQKYTVGGHLARHLVFELPAGFVASLNEPSYLALYVIQTTRALYVFLYRSPSPPDEATRQALAATVASFRSFEDD